MQKFLVVTQFLCVSLFVFGCGSDSISEEEAQEKYGCKIIEGPEGSDEYVLKCGDDSATISSGKDGADGQDGTSCTLKDNGDGTSLLECADGTSTTINNDGEKGDPGEKGDKGEDGQNGTDGMNGTDGKDGEKGDKGDKGDPGDPGQDGMDGVDGKSVDIQEKMLPVNDPNCPFGGKAIEFYVEGEMMPRAVNYQCNEDPAGSCPANHVMNMDLGYCIPWMEVAFTGVVSGAFGVTDLPMGQQPNNVVTTTQDPNNATPCSGVIRQPLGINPLGGFGDDPVAKYLFGNVAEYTIEMTVDNVTYRRNASYLSPHNAIHFREFNQDIDFNTGYLLPTGTLYVQTQVKPLVGFNNTDESTLTMLSTDMLAANQPYDLSLPNTLIDWTGLNAPIVRLNYNGTGATPRSSSITCEITQFTTP